MTIKEFTDRIKVRIDTFEIALEEFDLLNMSENEWLEGLVIHVKEQIRNEENNGK